MRDKWQGRHRSVASARFFDPPTYRTRPQSMQTVRYVLRFLVMGLLQIKNAPQREAFYRIRLRDYPMGLVQMRLFGE